MLDKRAEGDDVFPGPGRNSVSHEMRFKGKHFPTRVEKRSETICDIFL